MRILGGILAGGRGRRMPGLDKPLAPLAGRPLIAHVIARLAPQVDDTVINANGAQERFSEFGLKVIADRISGQQGPLAGIHALMHLAQERGASHVLVAPADTPFLPFDLKDRLVRYDPDLGITRIAASLGRRHPVVGLWPARLAEDLADHLLRSEDLSMAACLRRMGACEVDFPLINGVDPFLNINSPEDLDRAKRLLAGI